MQTLTVKFTRYLTKVHNTMYLALPREYTNALGLEKDTKVELRISVDGTVLVTPVQEAMSDE